MSFARPGPPRAPHSHPCRRRPKRCAFASSFPKTQWASWWKRSAKTRDPPTFAERVRAVLVELIKAKGTETRSPLPPGVELRRCSWARLWQHRVVERPQQGSEAARASRSGQPREIWAGWRKARIARCLDDNSSPSFSVPASPSPRRTHVVQLARVRRCSGSG